MSLEQKIRPINGSHSIKEAVISVFLVNPIIKPSRFRDLIETDFKDEYHQFRRLGQFKLHINQGRFANSPEITEDAGFRFSAFTKGQEHKVLQSSNDPGRNYISYHRLDYVNWNEFVDNYVKSISILSKHQSDLFVSAYSLHYIDQFLWIDKDNPIDLNLLLTRESEYLPNKLFGSITTNYSLVTEKLIPNSGRFVERLEVNVESKITPNILISHNITRPLDEVIGLNELIENKKFHTMLNAAHNENKLLLGNILTEPIKKMISL